MRIPRLILLALTLHTIPLLGQILLLNTVQVEPLPLTVRILAHHHLAKRPTPTVTVCWLFGVVAELSEIAWYAYSWHAQLATGRHRFLPDLAISRPPLIIKRISLLIRLFLHLASHFHIQLFIKLSNYCFQLLRDVMLLLVIPVNLFLLGDNLFVLIFNCRRKLMRWRWWGVLFYTAISRAVVRWLLVFA